MSRTEKMFKGIVAALGSWEAWIATTGITLPVMMFGGLLTQKVPAMAALVIMTILRFAHMTAGWTQAITVAQLMALAMAVYYEYSDVGWWLSAMVLGIMFQQVFHLSAC